MIDINSGSVIEKAEAVQHTNLFQEKFPDATKAYFVGKNKLNLILDQDGCIGVRIYDGFDAAGNVSNRVLVGVDATGEDMVNGTLLEHLVPCPKACSEFSPLIKR